MEKIESSNYYQLYMTAIDRLRPDGMAAWLMASNAFVGIIFSVSFFAIKGNSKIREDFWNPVIFILGAIFIVQILVMIFYLSLKNSYKYQKFLSVWTSFVATKMSVDSYLIFFILADDRGYIKDILYLAPILIIIGFLLNVFLTVRGFKRLRQGEFKKGGNYLYNFSKDKKNLGMASIFPVVLIVVSLFKSLQDYGGGIVGLYFVLLLIVILQYLLSVAIPEIYLVTYCKFKYEEFIVDIPPVLLKNLKAKEKKKDKSKKKVTK